MRLLISLVRFSLSASVLSRAVRASRNVSSGIDPVHGPVNLTCPARPCANLAMPVAATPIAGGDAHGAGLPRKGIYERLQVSRELGCERLEILTLPEELRQHVELLQRTDTRRGRAAHARDCDA